jgi:DNA topoisomerase IA
LLLHLHKIFNKQILFLVNIKGNEFWSSFKGSRMKVNEKILGEEFNEFYVANVKTCNEWNLPLKPFNLSDLMSESYDLVKMDLQDCFSAMNSLFAKGNNCELTLNTNSLI